MLLRGGISKRPTSANGKRRKSGLSKTSAFGPEADLQFAREGESFKTVRSQLSMSSSAFASRRSGVSKPSVNQP